MLDVNNISSALTLMCASSHSNVIFQLINGATDTRQSVYSTYMTRRIDHKTAERINLALLTRAAFDPPTARTYARLSGLPDLLVETVLERPSRLVRQQYTLFLPGSDRRSVDR